MKIKKCPSCGGPIEKTADGYFCSACDCTFKITREGPKVQATGKLDKIEARLDAIEEQIDPENSPSPQGNNAEPAPEDSPGPATPDDDEPELDDDDELFDP